MKRRHRRSLDTMLDELRDDPQLVAIRHDLAETRLRVKLLCSGSRRAADQLDHRDAIATLWRARADALKRAAEQSAADHHEGVIYGRGRSALLAAAESIRRFEREAAARHSWNPPAGGHGVDVRLLAAARAHGSQPDVLVATAIRTCADGRSVSRAAVRGEGRQSSRKRGRR